MKPWMGAFIRTLASRFGGVEEERRARGHSGPSVAATGARPTTPATRTPPVPDRTLTDLMAEPEVVTGESILIDFSEDEDGDEDDALTERTVTTKPGEEDTDVTTQLPAPWKKPPRP